MRLKDTPSNEDLPQHPTLVLLNTKSFLELLLFQRRMPEEKFPEAWLIFVSPKG
jgi:hypothetical protein